VTIGDLLAGALHMLVDINPAAPHQSLSRPARSGGKAVDYLSRKIRERDRRAHVFQLHQMSVFHIETIGEVLQSVMQGSRLSRVLGFGFIEQVAWDPARLPGRHAIGYSPTRALTSQAESFVDDKGQGAHGERHRLGSRQDRSRGPSPLRQPGD